MKPLIFDMNKKAAAVMTVCGLLGTIVLLTIEKPHTAADFLRCAIPLMIAGTAAVTLWLLHRYSAQVVLSEEGVSIENRLSGMKVNLPWTQFSYLYKIELSTLSMTYPFFLLSGEPMDKQTQKEMYERCAKNRKTPWIYEGCLLLNAYHYGSEIMERLPKHIRIMPWNECAHF